MIDAVPTWATTHAEELLLWSHGFFVALALRRGRIKTLLDRAIPTSDDDA
jgi:hypothetical protein